MATDTLAVTNLVARGYDPNVTQGGVLNEINVFSDKLNVKKIGAANKTDITIDTDVSITGEVRGTLNANNFDIAGNLDVGGTTTFKGGVDFTKATNSTITISDLTVTTELNI